jgi:hypothetical protein
VQDTGELSVVGSESDESVLQLDQLLLKLVVLQECATNGDPPVTVYGFKNLSLFSLFVPNLSRPLQRQQPLPLFLIQVT